MGDEPCMSDTHTVYGSQRLDSTLVYWSCVKRRLQELLIQRHKLLADRYFQSKRRVRKGAERGFGANQALRV